jgi:hypothetical protein
MMRKGVSELLRFNVREESNVGVLKLNVMSSSIFWEVSFFRLHDCSGESESIDVSGESESIDCSGESESIDVSGESESIDVSGESESIDTVISSSSMGIANSSSCLLYIKMYA